MKTGVKNGFSNPTKVQKGQDRQRKDIKATQTISQKLTEASGDNHSTRFKDIVPKPYQEFQDIFTKEAFDKLPNRKQWDHTIKLIPDA